MRSPTPRPRLTARGAAIAATGVLASIALAAPAASRDNPTAETDGTVSVAVRSITVSEPSFDFDACSAGGEDTRGKLTLPNGRCDGPTLTVTNGESSAHVLVKATDFRGSSSRKPEWRLCGPDDCAGGALPGSEEVAVSLGTSAGTHADDHLATELRCHTYWNPAATGDERCAAEPHQSVDLNAVLVGPASTSNGSPEFTTTITWTALP